MTPDASSFNTISKKCISCREIETKRQSRTPYREKVGRPTQKERKNINCRNAGREGERESNCRNAKQKNESGRRPAEPQEEKESNCRNAGRETERGRTAKGAGAQRGETQTRKRERVRDPAERQREKLNERVRIGLP